MILFYCTIVSGSEPTTARPDMAARTRLCASLAVTVSQLQVVYRMWRRDPDQKFTASKGSGG